MEGEGQPTMLAAMAGAPASETALRMSEERLRLAVAATGLGIFDWDLVTDRVTVNARFREIFGLPPGDGVIGAAMMGGVVHPDDRAFVESRIGAALDPASDGAYQFEHRAITLDGREIWVLTFGQVHFEGDGDDRRAVRVIGNDLDVTERKRAQLLVERLLAESELANEELQATTEELEERTEAAEEARRRTDAVLGSIADAFYLLDREWRFTHVNDAAEPLLQTTREALLGRTLWDAFPGVIGSPFEGPYREAMATGRPTSAEAYFPPLGTWFDVRTYPWSGGIMVHFRDIGERKAAELERERLLAATEAARAEAEAASARAEAASQAKSEFLAVMSHELRTPLNAILGYVQLLELGLAGPVSERQRDYLARLGASGSHLLSLVSDILDLAKVNVGEMSVARERAPVAPAIETALALVAPQAAARRIALATGEDGASAAVAYVGDESRVRQILANLLSNAIKFTEPGGRVTVESRIAAAAPSGVAGSGPWAAITVTDTGVGIPPEEQQLVFEEFHQVERGHTRTWGGTGLGLAISRRLARLMDGDLTLESVPGAGSTFTLWLPAADGRD